MNDRATTGATGTGIFLTAFAALLFISFQSILPAQPSGDEPHYLMLTVSLIREHDVNLADNYARADYRAFISTRLIPHRVTFDKDVIHSQHLPGLPALVALPYLLHGRTGAVCFLNFLAALTILQIFLWCRALEISKFISIFAAFAVGSSLSWVLMSGMMYPELAAAFCLITALRLFSTHRSFSSTAFGMALLCFLPWLHIKMAVPAIIGYLAFLFFNRKNFRRISILTIFAAIAAGLYFFFLKTTYGETFFLVRMQSGGFGNPFPGMSGLMLDREVGLLAFSPIFIFGIGGLLRTKQRAAGLWFAVLEIIAVWVLSGGFLLWDGGQCPPGRYLIPVLPLLGVLMADFIQQNKHVFTTIATAFFTCISLMNVFLMLSQGYRAALVTRFGYNQLYTRFPLVIQFLFPSLIVPSPYTWMQLISWLFFYSSCLLLMTGFKKHPRFSARIGMLMLLVSAIFIVHAARLETKYKVFQAKIPLADAAPRLLSPPDGYVVTDAIPEFRWKPVPGADAYLFRIKFPTGYATKMRIPGKNTFRIQSSALCAMPPGNYYWDIVPLKNSMRGKFSRVRLFIVKK